MDSTKKEGQTPRFQAYYGDNSLLIQFIITEFAAAFRHVRSIRLFFQELPASDSACGPLFSPLVHLAGPLVGQLSQRGAPPFSHGAAGSLTQLKTHCEQFSRNSFHRNPRHLTLHKTAYQAWLAAVHGFEFLNAHGIDGQGERSDASSLLLPIKRTFEPLLLRFNQLSRLLPRIIRDYWNDENVLLCLLRKQKILVEIYGSDFLYTHFKWPIKSQELARWLAQRYRSRGFETLVPTFQQLFH